MPTWEDIRNWLDEYNKTRKETQSWRSQFNSLERIFDFAEETGIKPDIAITKKKSNLLDIIPEAEFAVKRNDRKRLEQLFEWAVHDTNSQIRLKLRGENRDLIKVKRLSSKFGDRYELQLTDEQFKRIGRSTRQQFEYFVMDTE